MRKQNVYRIEDYSYCRVSVLTLSDSFKIACRVIIEISFMVKQGLNGEVYFEMM
jgi:hypothetical protein